MLPSLTQVFGVHRFIAGGFGVLLLVAPVPLGQLFSPSQTLQHGEMLALQSWGCFIIAVALIAHSARAFPAAAQQAVGRALVVCFALLVALYARAVLAWEMDVVGRRGVMVTGATFAGLALAYGCALASDHKNDSDPAKRR